MARPKLRSKDQPFLVQLALGTFEFLSSLKLAVALILSAAFALAWSTFVESTYGTPVVQWGMYGTWWFAGLNLLLAVNIFCAAAIRYPWKRHQTGFVITHIGLLTLLFGCLVTRQRWIDAQMPVFEGDANSRAFEHSRHFQITVDKPGEKPGEYRLPFVGGPFNWRDFDGRLRRPIESHDDEAAITSGLRTAFAAASGTAFSLARRDRGTVFDQDGIRLDVLDYYSDSIDVDVPNLRLKISMPRATDFDAEGKPKLGTEKWMPVELSVRPLLGARWKSHLHGIGARRVVGGGAMVFWLAGSQAEVDAFLRLKPEDSLGKQGQVVLSVAGEPVRFLVEDKLGKGRFALGKSAFEAELAKYFANATINPHSLERMELIDAGEVGGQKNPGVELNLFRDGKAAGRLVLLADMPEWNEQDEQLRAFGSYWFDHGEKTAAELMQGGGASRIDIVQGPDEKLYYRYWNRKQVVAAKALPLDGTPVDAFKMPIAQLHMRVDKLIASERPERRTMPVEFDALKLAVVTRPAAKVRLSVDGHAEEFWLVGPSVSAAMEKTLQAPRDVGEATVRTVEAGGRRVSVSLPSDEFDLGFQVRLQDFERRLDPGTEQPSHYSSVVDFLSTGEDPKILQADVFITMNAPVDFSDPRTGRSYRLFQESFNGPFLPGTREFDARVDRLGGADELYLSVLTVNYDPGRAIKYTGCLLVVAGITTMFYMRAYFFKPHVKPVAVAKGKRRASPQPMATGAK